MKYVETYKKYKISKENLTIHGRKTHRYEAVKGKDVIANGLSLSHIRFLIDSGGCIYDYL